MPSAAKPAAANRSLEARLTRKVGPLPVVAWAALILGAYLLYARLHKTAAAVSTDATAVPAASSTSPGDQGASQLPSSGQGGSADNLNGDLIAALGANSAAVDALTAQVLSAQPGQPGDGSTVQPWGIVPLPGGAHSTPLVVTTPAPLVPTPNHPAAVAKATRSKISTRPYAKAVTANKTGATAVRGRGVIAIH